MQQAIGAILQLCINYWINDAVVDVRKKHEKYLLVNIANEAGDYSISISKFRNGYQLAVRQMRDTGIHVPIVIDGSDWGKNVNILQSEGPDLIQTNPDHNLIFSVHMWGPQKCTATTNRLLRQKSPNPAKNQTSIQYSPGSASMVELKVFDAQEKLTKPWLINTWKWEIIHSILVQIA